MRTPQAYMKQQPLHRRPTGPSQLANNGDTSSEGPTDDAPSDELLSGETPSNDAPADEAPGDDESAAERELGSTRVIGSDYIPPVGARSAEELSVLGDFELLDKLGEGAMGAVYKAR